MLRILTAIVAFSLTALLGACGPSDVIACDPSGCISESKLKSNLVAKLDGNVVGYVAMVGDMTPAFGGQRRTATDPPSGIMLPYLGQINIASVSKTLTAVAVLKILAQNNLSLDNPIGPSIYPDWKKGANVSTITFRQLLTHRAGIRANCDGSNTTYPVLKSVVAAGVNKADQGVGSYNNCNFALFRELFPTLLGVDLTKLSDVDRAKKSADLYIDTMNKLVFQPVGVPINASGPAVCAPPATASDTVLTYPNPAGSTPGTDWGIWTSSCGGGGWVLSAGDVFTVIKDIAAGSTLLTPSQRQTMLQNCLGWDCAVRSDCPNPYDCKNGGLNNGSVVLWTYAGIFKCNVPVVVVVNSQLPPPYPSNGDIIGLVKDAYTAAAVVGAPKPCT